MMSEKAMFLKTMKMLKIKWKIKETAIATNSCLKETIKIPKIGGLNKSLMCSDDVRGEKMNKVEIKNSH